MSDAADKTAKQQRKRTELAGRIAAYLLQHGLTDSGLRTLARAAGTSDRMLIYYFQTKEHTITAALSQLVGALTEQLDALVPERNVSGKTLLTRLNAASEDAALRPIFQLWFELVGRAMRDEQPYREIAEALAGEWLTWIESKLPSRGDPGANRDRALELLAQVEGRIMLSLLRG